MKKLIALLLAALAVAALAACGAGSDKPEKTTEPSQPLKPNEPTERDDPTQSVGLTKPSGLTTSDDPTASEETTVDDVAVGGWQLTDSPAVTDEVKALVEKATSQSAEAMVQPVAYIASQLVAGMNRLVLCKVVNASASTYALVTIYEDLQGNAEVIDLRRSAVSAVYPPGLDGGWGEADDPAVSNGVRAMMQDIVTDGIGYRPLALLATQIVGGMNYRLLCCVTTPDGQASLNYVIVEVYRDFDGNAQIISTQSFK